MGMYLGEQKVLPIIDIQIQGKDKGGKYLVRVIDYDGTVLKQDHLNEGATFKMPNNPSHTGLVFDGWSSPVTISNGIVTVGNSDITIGAMYHTASGLTEFDISLTEATGLNVTLKMDGTKNWGDGTSDTSTTHTYASVGDYTITCDGSTMTTSINTGLFNQNENRNCSYIKEIRLGRNVTNIAAYAFWHCDSLTSVIIPRSVTSIDNYAFYSYNCFSPLTSITIPDSITIINSFVFNYCYSLIAIVIPNSITTINGYAFGSCHSLTSITIPSSVTTIGGSVFSRCYSLTNITLPSSVTTIGSNTFEYCYSITSITIPEGVTSIGQQIFYDCYSLANITIPEGVTNIGNGAFYYCYSLTKITIPKSVTNIINSAFYNCHSILEYDFSNHTTVPTLSSTNVFNNINQVCKIYVPWNLYSNWKTATNWNTYANYITVKNPATLNFTVTPSNSTIFVEGTQIQGTSISWVGPSAPYIIYNSTNKVIYQGIQTGITEGATVNIATDLTSYNKITLSTGITGLSPKFTVGGVTFNATDEGSGNYSINVVGSGTTINYFIDGGSNYMDASGSITTTGSDITKTVTITPATEVSFTRPNLTSNGTLGGNSFAVKDLGAGTLTTYPWRAVDSSTTTYWNGQYPSGSKTYIFYNPDALKVSKLTYTYTSSTYRATAVSIQGSDDNSTWNSITSSYSGSSTTYTSTLTNSKFYKYYKLTFTPNSNYVRIYNLAITATYKTPAS